MSKMQTLGPVLALLTAVVGCGNSDHDAAPGAASGSPSAAAAGASGAPAAAGGKTVHIKRSFEECTFELDAPEELKDKEKDGISFTIAGPSFAFRGNAGQTMYGLDGLAGLMRMGDTEPPLFKGTANGVHLVIGRNPNASDPINGVSGNGEEAEHKERQLGCSFMCSGVKTREAELIAMCKSVRITYDKSKAH